MHLWREMVVTLTTLKQHSRAVPRHWLDRTRWENVFTPSRNQFLRLFLRLWSSSLFLSHLRLCLAERVLHVHKYTGCQWCPRFHCGHFLHQASTVRICQYVKCEWTLSLSSVLILEVLVLPGDQCVYRFNPFDLFVINLLWRITTCSLLRFFFVKLCTVFILLSCYVDP